MAKSRGPVFAREQRENLANPMPGGDGGGGLCKISIDTLETKLALELFRRAGNYRPEKDAQGAADFRQSVKYII